MITRRYASADGCGYSYILIISRYARVITCPVSDHRYLVLLRSERGNGTLITLHRNQLLPSALPAFHFEYIFHPKC